MAIARLTFSSQQLLIRDNLQRVQSQYQAASIPALTGRRVNNLSDDPTNTSRIFVLREEVKNKDQYQRNLTNAKLKLSEMDARLADVNDLMLRVRDITLQANNSGLSSATLTELSSQIAGLKGELLGYANTRTDNSYIFAGTAVNTAPFSGTPTAYQGNTDTISVQANANVRISTNVDASVIFSGAGGGEDLFDLLDDLQTAIDTGDHTTMTSSLTRIDAGLGQVNAGRASVGTRIQQIEAIESSLADDRVTALQKLSDIQDINIDEAISSLVTKETALKLVFSSASRVMSVLGNLNLQS